MERIRKTQYRLLSADRPRPKTLFRYRKLHTYAEILSSLYELLKPIAGELAQDIGEDTDLVGELELTSLKIMDLLMEVEDRFDVTIPLNRLAEVRTVGDLAAMLDKLINRPS